MKFKLLVLLFSAISIASFAQFPFNGFNYQGVVRDANGKGFDAQNIGVKFELFNHVSGLSVYNETINTTTNKFGLFTYVLGSQAPLQFAVLPWDFGIDLEVSVDTAGGVSYMTMGPKTQFEGVPFSIFSYASFLGWNRSGNVTAANDYLGTINLNPLIFKTNSLEAMRIDINQNVGIGNSPTSKLDVTGDIHATDSIMSNSKISAGSYVNTLNGYKYKNSAVTGKYLRGNGSYFIADSIKLADLPAAIAFPPWTRSGTNIYPANLGDKVGINNNAPVQQLDVVGGANTTLGYKYNGTAVAGKYLRANGSYFIADSIKASDLPGGTSLWKNISGTLYPNNITDKIHIGGNVSVVPNLQVSGNDGIWFRGTHGAGTAWDANAGSWMIWYPKKSAFRAGAVNGTQWNDASLGAYSAALGYNPTASGDSSIALGNTPTASGLASIAIGSKTKATGVNSMAIGYRSEALGLFSYSFGFFSKANNQGSVAIGANAVSNANNAIALGVNVITSAPNNCVIGSGISAILPLSNTIPNSIQFGMGSNLPTMHISPAPGLNGIGKVGIGTTSPLAPLSVVGTVSDTTVGRFNGSNIFGTSVLIYNTVNSPSTVLLKSSNMAAKLSFVPSPMNRLMVENQNSGGHIILETTQRIKLNADTISFHGLNGVLNKMIIDNNGRVGIGTTNPNGHMLDVSSTAGSPGNSAIRALYPAGGPLLNTEFAVLANRAGLWTALYAKQGASSSAAYFDGNVGIGIIAPSAKLDVVGGNIKIDAVSDYRFRNIKAKAISVPCIAFVEAGVNNDIFDITSDPSQLWVWAKSVTGNAGQFVYLSAPIYLPDSATVTDFEATFSDNTILFGNTAELVRATAGGTTITMATVSTSAVFNAGQTTQTTNSITNPIIETGVYKYWIRYTAVTYTNPLSHTAIYGAKIKYTITKVD